MRDAVDVPVTVKHRIGIDRGEGYGIVRDFVGPLNDAGCSVFIVHARNAWLKGLSPRENREVPPLRYAVVRRLKREFPHVPFVLNGGLTSLPQAIREAAGLDGVMLGRSAYHEPYLLAAVDACLYDAKAPVASRADVVGRMTGYLHRAVAQGVAPRQVVRHMHGLFQGQRGARQWRRMLSDATELDAAGAGILNKALSEIETPDRAGVRESAPAWQSAADQENRPEARSTAD